MNLLIIDDEPKIRRGLYNYLSNLDLKFNSIETAENGLIALEKTRKTKPDIVLADICMPKMDGLEFINNLLYECKDVKIIIISGHDDFSYAQKALRYGVEDYLLKPIDLQNLYSVIKKAYDKILSEKDKNKHVTFAMDIIHSNRHMLTSQLFTQILNCQISPENIDSMAQSIGISIPDPASLIIIKLFERHPEAHIELERDLLSYAVINIVCEICEDLEKLICFTDIKDNTVVLSSYSESVDYINIQEEICKSIERYLGYAAKSDASFLENTCVNFRNAYEQMVHYLSNINEYSITVINAKNYIEQNYHRENLTLKSVAAALHVNASYLSRMMQKQLGMSFVNYLTDVRMKKAAISLNNAEKDIKLYEISQKLGYSSQHYFSRVFTKYYGKSPLQFRSEEGERN